MDAEHIARLRRRNVKHGGLSYGSCGYMLGEFMARAEHQRGCVCENDYWRAEFAAAMSEG